MGEGLHMVCGLLAPYLVYIVSRYDFRYNRSLENLSLQANLQFKSSAPPVTPTLGPGWTKHIRTRFFTWFSPGGTLALTVKRKRFHTSLNQVNKQKVQKKFLRFFELSVAVCRTIERSFVGA
jgi:hypothetical protein